VGVVEEEVNKVVTVVDRHRPDVLKFKQGQVREQATHTHTHSHIVAEMVVRALTR